MTRLSAPEVGSVLSRCFGRHHRAEREVRPSLDMAPLEVSGPRRLSLPCVLPGSASGTSSLWLDMPTQLRAR